MGRSLSTGPESPQAEDSLRYYSKFRFDSSYTSVTARSHRAHEADLTRIPKTTPLIRQTKLPTPIKHFLSTQPSLRLQSIQSWLSPRSLNPTVHSLPPTRVILRLDFQGIHAPRNQHIRGHPRGKHPRWHLPIVSSTVTAHRQTRVRWCEECLAVLYVFGLGSAARVPVVLGIAHRARGWCTIPTLRQPCSRRLVPGRSRAHTAADQIHHGCRSHDWRRRNPVQEQQLLELRATSSGSPPCVTGSRRSTPAKIPALRKIAATRLPNQHLMGCARKLMLCR